MPLEIDDTGVVILLVWKDGSRTYTVGRIRSCQCCLTTAPVDTEGRNSDGEYETTLECCGEAHRVREDDPVVEYIVSK